MVRKLGLTGIATVLFALACNVPTKTSVAAPGSVTITAPINGSTGISTTPTLTWSAGAGGAVDKYLIKISTVNTFATTVVTDSTGSLSYTLPTSLSNNTTYYWEIAAKNSNSTSSYVTSIFTTIIAAPGPVTLTAPLAGAAGILTTPVLTWTTGAGGPADKYLIKVSTASTFATTVVTDSTSNLSYSIPTALSNSTVYYWEIAAKNANTTSSYVTSNFTTIVATPAGMHIIPTGTFQMGSTTGFSDEAPVHTVTLSTFFMDTTEVTQAAYLAVMGINPSLLAGNLNMPVEGVTWYDAILYCNARSHRDGLDTVYSFTSITGTRGNGCSNLGNLTVHYLNNGYRLPTESEWEYAYRAGSTTEFYWGNTMNDDYSWWAINASGTTHTVALLKPNTWGLYDMSGNVWEYVNDLYGQYSSGSSTDPTGPLSGYNHPLRGGSWDNDYNSNGHYLSSTVRNPYSSSQRNDIGFRCVRR